MTQENEPTKKGISRRQFIGGTVGGLVVGAAAGAVVGSLAFPKATSATPWLPASWDHTADVVVLGTGLAGLSSAITAHDAGADVLVLEKLDQAHEGGNSKVSGNLFWAPADVTQGAAYIKAMEVGQLADDAIINALSAGLQENLTVIKNMGGAVTPSGLDSPEFPKILPGGSTVTMYAISVGGAPALGGGHLYKLYRDAVTSRNISIMYSTPATGLIQNGDTKEILGVTALSGGSVDSNGLPNGGNHINIRANKAVILACGGFEFNLPMQAQFQFGYPIYGWGTPGNTGDGIMMAQKAGADLWHMNQPSGGSPGAIVVPDFPYPVGMLSFFGLGNNYIWVDKHGNRYVNESLGFASHGWGVKEYSEQFNGVEGAFLRIPSWMVFDDTARAAGPLASNSLFGTTIQMGWFGWYSGYHWSKDYQTEVSKGWVLKANTIAGLAAQIAADKDNFNPLGQPTVDAATLEASIARFNALVSSGTDTDFGRPKATMGQIQTAPFYAVKIWPGMVNTNGGPRRNINCQVVDPSGNTIPRLYGAGECGSFWGWMYNGGGNIGECMWTGRVAGKAATAETTWA
jgi:succinate dehydrogenase/fumarate reductase flavoprotein subunit